MHRARPAGWTTLLLAAVLTAPACQDAPGDLAPAASTGGIPTTVLTAEALGEAPLLTLDLDLRIPGGERQGPEYLLSRVLSLAADDHGRVYVLEGSDPVLRVFNPDGTLSRVIGRRGDGPGEFQRPRLVAVGKDTVFVVHERLELYHIEGGHLASVGTDFFLWQRVRAIAGTDHGIFVLVGNLAPRYEGRDSLALRRLDPRSGTLGDPVVQLPLPELYQLSIGLYATRLGAHDPRLGVTRDGRVVTTLGYDFEIDVTSVDGEPIRRLSGEAAPRPVTREDVRSWTEGIERSLQGREPISRDAVGDIPVPQAYPILGGMLVSPDGSIIVERQDLREQWRGSPEPRWWNLIAADGRVAGRVALNPRFQPLVFRDCSLLGIERDELDVQTVVRYRLRRAGPERATPCP